VIQEIGKGGETLKKNMKAWVEAQAGSLATVKQNPEQKKRQRGSEKFLA